MAGHIYVTGDCHGDRDTRKLNSKQWPDGTKLDREDYLIVCGDMAVVWDVVSSKQEKNLVKWYSEMKPWTTLFVDGNHENHDRLQQLKQIEMFGGVVGVVAPNVYHLRRGEIYTINGSTFFTMGGAVSIDKVYRTEGISWWANEVANYAELDHGLENLDKVHNKVDYIISHTMPSSLLSHFGFIPRPDPMANYFDAIAKLVTFQDWFFGHFHDDIHKGPYHCLYDEIYKIK